MTRTALPPFPSTPLNYLNTPYTHNAYTHAPMSPPTPHTTPPPLTRQSIEAAHALIQPYIHRTPVLTNTTLTNLASTPQTADALKGTQWEGQEPAKPKMRLFFKCENFQRIGAFKVRGAFHAVLRLVEEMGIDEVRRRGVVTHSSGMSCPYLWGVEC
jgi:threonine dehydratase